MKIKTTLAVIALALVPTLTLAEGGCHHSTTAAQCAAGQSYDVTSGKCVTTTS